MHGVPLRLALWLALLVGASCSESGSAGDPPRRDPVAAREGPRSTPTDPPRTGGPARASGSAGYEPRAGDLLFQKSTSRQSVAVQAATGSDYTHMGMVVPHGTGLTVLEAVSPVSHTPLDRWVARGRGAHFVAMRLRDADVRLTETATRRLVSEASRHLGKPYDTLFAWSDDRMYCSELVWKAYERALGLELGAAERFRDLALDAPAVRALVAERVHGALELDERIVTPVAMMRSPLLVEVARN